MTTITEAEVEAAALDWLAALGWQVAHDPDIAPDTPGTGRADYGRWCWNVACVIPWRGSIPP